MFLISGYYPWNPDAQTSSKIFPLRQRSDTKACSADSAKIAFHIRVLGAFNQIMQQPAPFLFFFNIPRWISIIKKRKFINFYLAKNWKKKLGVPLAFFQFSSENFSFEIPSYYDWNQSRVNRKELKRCRLLHNLIERLENANVKSDFHVWAEQAFMSEPCHLPGWTF